MAPAASPDGSARLEARRLLLALLACLVFASSLTGCAETSLLIVVTGDYVVPDELDTLQIVVTADGAEMFDEYFTLEAADTLNESLTLLPGAHVDADLEIGVIGRLGGSTGDQVAQGSRRIRFSESEQVRIEVTLTTLCGGLQCQHWEWCVEDACVSRPCQDAIDCDDGDPCNGAEVCNGGTCGPSLSPPCDDDDPCTTDICIDEASTCRYEPLDADGDGQSPLECGGTDCDDTSELALSGGTEICDGLDNDCENGADDGFECVLGDSQPCTTDCDTDGAIHCEEGCTWGICTAPEDVCNHIDDDCDGFIDDDAWQVEPASGQRVSTGPDRSQDADLVAVTNEISGEVELYGLVWSDARHGDTEIFFATLDTSGALVGEPLRVTDAPGDSDSPRIVWSGSAFIVVWTDSRPGGTEIFAQRLTPPPSVALDGDPIQVTSSMGNASESAIVWASDVAGLIWIERVVDSMAVQLMLLDTYGVAATTPETMTEADANSSTPDITWTDASFGVVWTDSTATGDVVSFAEADVLGARLAVPRSLTEPAISAEDPSIIWADTNYVIVWSDGRTAPARLFATVLDFGGGVTVDPTPLTSSGISTRPDIAWTGSELVVAWTVEDTAKEIAMGRYAIDLEPISAVVQVTTTGGSSDGPTVLPFVSGVVMAWEDGRDGNDEIYSAFVGCSGL